MNRSMTVRLSANIMMIDVILAGEFPWILLSSSGFLIKKMQFTQWICLRALLSILYNLE